MTTPVGSASPAPAAAAAAAARDDVTPTEIMKVMFEECKPYEKYRGEFRPVYDQLLTNVGVDEADFTVPRTQLTMRFNVLWQRIVEVNTILEYEQFLIDVRSWFDVALARENDYFQQLRRLLQPAHDYFNNGFEAAKLEFQSLAPQLEELQKTRPVEPEQIQLRDRVTSRFQELQRQLKTAYSTGIEKTQTSHLKMIRDVIEEGEKWQEALEGVLAPIEKMVVIKRRRVEPLQEATSPPPLPPPPPPPPPPPQPRTEAQLKESQAKAKRVSEGDKDE